jgi:hypothetical protein
MYYQDIHTNEILKLKSEWFNEYDRHMAYFQTELGATITMDANDLRIIYSLTDLRNKYSDESKVQKVYNLQKQLAKRGARITVYVTESENRHLHNWSKDYKGEMIVEDFDIGSESVKIKDYLLPIKFNEIDSVYHLDFQRFTVDEVAEVIHSLDFDHENKCIEHSEKITMGEALLTRTVFIRDNKTRKTAHEIKNAEQLDDVELYEVLIEKIKELSSKAILNI